jgi:hypothetical protein
MEDSLVLKACIDSVRYNRMEFTEEDFGSYVCTGPHGGPDVNRVGRVVQVRLEDGDFGSDTVFLRHSNGNLQMHTNNFYEKVNPLLISALDKMYKTNGVYWDQPGESYTKGGKFKRKGFIIKSKVKPGETTPMREVRKGIMENLERIIKK